MKVIPVKQAVGMVLGHDVTEIIPNVSKGCAFKKGHVIKPEDVEKLLDIGKEHIYVLELEQGVVHEDDAAVRIAKAASGPNVLLSDPSEGKVSLTSLIRGLLKINVDGLHQINRIQDIAFSTLHSFQQVEEGQLLAGTRIIPLVTREETVREVEEVCGNCFPLITVKPFKPANVGIITTGSEIYTGRIEDRFGPILRDKFSQLGSQVIDQVMVSDDTGMTVEAIKRFIDQRAEMIVITGGMSVDPDDQTPASIIAAGAEVVTYGAPTFPGAMFMLAFINEIPVLGLPGCVMYYKASIFDLIVPRILAGETPTREEIARLGHGGLCRNCPDCRFPNCGFGK